MLDGISAHHDDRGFRILIFNGSKIISTLQTKKKKFVKCSFSVRDMNYSFGFPVWNV